MSWNNIWLIPIAAIVLLSSLYLVWSMVRVEKL